ncbi:hypothetical protein MNBD_NITROSPINAE01-658 [hydrothermal vent metagenome]|uniref:Zn-ribbon-containing, possibly RNA-binding protein and truncated derivatives n=1 Tax=hydrothermal vent metagenome TaxID=652676 RepID=A0A3B1C807_9ZZZZ
MSKRNRSPKTIGSVIESLLLSIDREGLYNLAKIELQWEDIVGPQLAAISVPARLAGKKLTVWAAEPVWVDSMSYHKADIISKVNSVLGKHTVTSVEIAMNVEAKSRNKRPEPKQNEQEQTEPMSGSAIAEMEKALDEISDSQLRSTFKKVILKSARRNP